ncbi:multicopper oxidase domain-containing protein [Nocardia sp. IBHARD005]|uniref:multicopper oxidase domain-containing protein n=1 Tax=Nocardia sp. IBHARD005 TaxID=3457765 RepID=UPI004058A23B
MYHCHLLWHEDVGMMGQFTVVEPGQQAAKPLDTPTDPCDIDTIALNSSHSEFNTR